MNSQILKRMQGFIKDEEGATAVEYGLMVAAIAAVIILVVFTLGETVRVTFDDVDQTIKNKGVVQ